MKLKRLLPLAVLVISSAQAATNPQIDFARYQTLVAPIVKNMTLEQLIGQMSLAPVDMLANDQDYVQVADVEKYQLGGVFVAGNTAPAGKCDAQGNCLVVSNPDKPLSYKNANMKNWQSLMAGLNQQHITVKVNDEDVSIYPLAGTDAVHGDQHVIGSVLFPQNIALAATHNPQNFYNAGFWTAQSVLDSGYNWVFAPTVAISNNPQWGRSYETLGNQLNDIPEYVNNYILGAQEADDYIHGVLTSTKHFLGDGATYDGVDEGDVQPVSDMARFLSVNSVGYKGAFEAQSANVMISYSAVNQIPMSINDKLLQLLFSGQYDGKTYFPPFQGFTVSDYGAIDKVSGQQLPTTNIKMPYPEALSRSINSGMDMVMLSPYTYYGTVAKFQATLAKAVADKSISRETLEKSVTRILAVKYAMGLIKDSNGNVWLSKASFKHSSNMDDNNNLAAAAAMQAAEQSLVLLKNDNNTLPLNSNKLKYIILLGQHRVKKNGGSEVYPLYNNLGVQNGGWTIRWQGYEGNFMWNTREKRSAHGSTLLDGIKSIVPNRMRIITADNFVVPADMTAGNTVVIALAAEVPYAEFMGDVGSPYCANATSPNDSSHGCLYNQHLNPYMPEKQAENLQLTLDKKAQKDINIIHDKDKKVPVVTVLFSGRPMMVDPLLDESQAFIAAWLPGTAGGQAVANAIFGKYGFCGGQCNTDSPNTLPVNWPSDTTNLKEYPTYSSGSGVPDMNNTRFKSGYGLATQASGLAFNGNARIVIVEHKSNVDVGFPAVKGKHSNVFYRVVAIPLSKGKSVDSSWFVAKPKQQELHYRLPGLTKNEPYQIIISARDAKHKDFVSLSMVGQVVPSTGK